MDLTPKQLHILRHSLGLNEKGYGRPYRNHYVAGVGHHSYQDLQTLMASGHMGKHAPSKLLGEGDECFFVTPLGESVAIVPEPPLPRPKRRWRAYRELHEVCPDLTFQEFLTRPQFAPNRA